MKTSHDALIAATTALVREGRHPTANVAAAAGISRATVYRYFHHWRCCWRRLRYFEAGGPRFPPRSEDLPLADVVGHLRWSVGFRQ